MLSLSLSPLLPHVPVIDPRHAIMPYVPERLANLKSTSCVTRNAFPIRHLPTSTFWRDELDYRIFCHDGRPLNLVVLGWYFAGEVARGEDGICLVPWDDDDAHAALKLLESVESVKIREYFAALMTITNSL